MASKSSKTKIEKAARLAISVGNLVLACTDTKLQRRVARLRHVASVLDQLQPNQKTPTPKSRSTSARRQNLKQKLQPTGIVYLLKAGPFYKIGKTTDFDRRLNQIKLQLPYSVEVVHTISATDISTIETLWHRKFAHRRANGEWFTLNDAEVAEFKSYSFM